MLARLLEKIETEARNERFAKIVEKPLDLGAMRKAIIDLANELVAHTRSLKKRDEKSEDANELDFEIDGILAAAGFYLTTAGEIISGLQKNLEHKCCSDAGCKKSRIQEMCDQATTEAVFCAKITAPLPTAMNVSVGSIGNVLDSLLGRVQAEKKPEPPPSSTNPQMN